MARVVVLGSINLDLVVATDVLPGRGQTIVGRDFKRFGGGKGANQALAAARVGADVMLVGRVGNDEPGRLLLGELAREGVDVSRVAKSGSPTGTALITVDADGDNTIVVVPGANGEVGAPDVDAARPDFEACESLVLQLEVPMAANIRAAEIARTAGATVFLNPSPASPVPDALLANVSYLVLNEGEAGLLSDGGGPGALLERGVGSVVVTFGERGAELVTRGRTRGVPAFAVEVVDTTAAGDAFLGALAALLPERGPDLALEAASAAGAIAATRWGAQPSLPTLDEIERLLLK